MINKETSELKEKSNWEAALLELDEFVEYIDQLEKTETEEFKPMSNWKVKSLNEEEMRKYYIQLRKYQYENNLHTRGKLGRDILHPFLLALMSIDRKFLKKQTLKILNDKRDKKQNKKKPVIYAITHIGMHDIQVVSEAIKKHQYTFLGDPETMYFTSDGKIMEKNGVVYCDTDDKGDRIIGKETAKDHLKNGTNLMIFPEGVWNVTSNLLMLPLFSGIIDMALDTECDIVPVAIEQYGNDFIVNMGSNFELKKKNSDFKTEEERKEYVEVEKENLRDEMATLKWEIFESRPLEERKNLGLYKEADKAYRDMRYNEWYNKEKDEPFYNDDIVKRRTYKVKNVTFAEDAFSYISKLKLNKNNAFVFRQDDSLPNSIQDEIKQKIK